jgi:hydroxymethylglutaryl-CoA lyase
MLSRMGVETRADFATVETVANEVRERLGLGATSHVLMGGTVENVLATMGGDDGGAP